VGLSIAGSKRCRPSVGRYSNLTNGIVDRWF
jgi:hypothetical protein